MKITIFGAGYVGLVSAVCFAELGHDVVCVDVNEEKILKLQQGESPIFEPGLTEMLKKTLQAKKITFTTNIIQAVQHGFFQFIAVGTPSDEDGSADLSYVLAVAKSIGEYICDYCIVVNKSTVPVGSAAKVRQVIIEAQQQRNVHFPFDVVSNPEFLKEGHAIGDFMQPDRIIVGADSSEVISKMRELYAALLDHSQRFITMDVASAELTKYAANAFLATKISFMNVMSQLAERVGADIDDVRKGIGTDPRIGSRFLFAGCGYGGACFPKDVRALKRLAENQSVDCEILTAVENVNIKQKQILLQKIRHYFNNDLEGKVIALWGLSFKPNTDDMREAASRVLMEALWQEGAKVQAYDPIAINEIQKIYGERIDLQLYPSATAALEGADALAIVTEWQEFRQPDFATIKNKLRHPVIFDGRNLYDPASLKKQGLIYYGIGRGISFDT